MYIERGRRRYSARKLAAVFFGVTEYEIRKAVKLTLLIPPLQDKSPCSAISVSTGEGPFE